MKSRFGTVALGVAGITLAARVVGFGRWLVFSKTVGDTCLGDVYNAANTLPNVLFEIVAGGVLAGVVIPVMARHVGAQRRSEAAQTASSLLTWTLIILTPAALAALLAAPIYGTAFAKPACENSAVTVAALLIMFVPQIWLYGLAVVSAGVLQAHSRFLAASLAPLVSSAVVITSYLIFLGAAPPNAQEDLAQVNRSALRSSGWGTTLGVLALALTTVIPMARLGHRLRTSAPVRRRRPSGDRPDRGSRDRRAGGAAAQLARDQLVGAAHGRSGGTDPLHLGRRDLSAAVRGAGCSATPGGLSAPLDCGRGGRFRGSRGAGSGRSWVIMLGSLGAALLVATAVPVARVFVLGPGSGDTAALAWLIAALAPAVVGFAMLGLASRTLLAQHRARAAGGVTMTAWTVVIVAALSSRLVVPLGWQVVALATSVSLGMCAGGVLGAILTRRPAERGSRGPGWVARS